VSWSGGSGSEQPTLNPLQNRIKPSSPRGSRGRCCPSRRKRRPSSPCRSHGRGWASAPANGDGGTFAWTSRLKRGERRCRQEDRVGKEGFFQSETRQTSRRRCLFLLCMHWLFQQLRNRPAGVRKGKKTKKPKKAVLRRDATHGPLAPGLGSGTKNIKRQRKAVGRMMRHQHVNERIRSALLCSPERPLGDASGEVCTGARFSYCCCSWYSLSLRCCWYCWLELDWLDLGRCLVVPCSWPVVGPQCKR